MRMRVNVRVVLLNGIPLSFPFSRFLTRSVLDQKATRTKAVPLSLPSWKTTE